MMFQQLVAQASDRRYSRRTVLQGGVALGAGAAALSVFGAPAFHAGGGAAAAPLDSDIDILNYALTLEFLEAAAYKVINDSGFLSGRAATYFQAFGQHEAEHVTALLGTIPQLGGVPVPIPAFNFSSVPKDPVAIVRFFQQVEALGVSAYLGAAPFIKSFDVLEAALSIHAVEAEHAAALADLVAPGTDLFAPAAFEVGRSPAEVLAQIAPLLASIPAPPPTGSGGTLPGMPSTGGGFAAGLGGGLASREMSRGR